MRYCIHRSRLRKSHGRGDALCMCERDLESVPAGGMSLLDKV